MGSFRSGFVSVVGRPNVGKSTLINKMANTKISIISDKYQTTRNVIKAIITKENSQIVLVDTPGIINPRNKLGEYMKKVALGSLEGADLILFITEATSKGPGAGDLEIMEQLKKTKIPVFLILNKIDLVLKESLLGIISSYDKHIEFKNIIPVSAILGEGTDLLMGEIEKILPEGPKYFPEDTITDQPERIIAAEIIREKLLVLLEEEIPHGIGVEIISFKERPDGSVLDIQANIYCERESHKGIVIGKKGALLKKVGTLARQEIENIFNIKVFLQLWVKTKKDWRNKDMVLRTLGYN